MKTIFSLLILSCIYKNLHAQDSIKINQIDSLVDFINNSGLPLQHDTIIQEYKDVGLKITTYLTVIVNDKKLMKYMNQATTIMTDNGKTRQLITSNSFYYDNNQLIKVEEYVLEDKKKETAYWYYSEDKPLYYTLQSKSAAERAAELIIIAKEIVKKFIP